MAAYFSTSSSDHQSLLQSKIPFSSLDIHTSSFPRFTNTILSTWRGLDAGWIQISWQKVPCLGSHVGCGLAYIDHSTAMGVGV